MFNSIKARLKSLKKQGKYGAGYVDTVVKVITCVVVGALLLTGIYAIANTGMTTASNKTDSLFSYEAELPGGPGGAGGGGALPDGEGVSMLTGAGQTHNRATPRALSFRSSAPLDTFEKVIIDGVEIDSNCYTLESGSTKVIFKDIFTKSLTDGEHNIEIVSADGTATADFTVTMTPGVYDENWELVDTWDDFLANMKNNPNNEEFLPFYKTERQINKEWGAPEEALEYFDDTKPFWYNFSGAHYGQYDGQDYSLALPVGGKYIASYCFQNAPFKSIVVLGGVGDEFTSSTAIDDYAFLGSEIEAFYLMDPYKAIGFNVFEETSLKDFYYNGTMSDFELWCRLDGDPINSSGPSGITVHCLDGDIENR